MGHSIYVSEFRGEARSRGGERPGFTVAAAVPHLFDVDEYAQDFSVDEFFRRVSEREQENAPVAAFHARVVLEVLQEAVSPGELQEVFDQLPADWRRVFAIGSTGTLKLRNSRRVRTSEEKRMHPRSTIEKLTAKARTQAETQKTRRAEQLVTRFER